MGPVRVALAIPGDGGGTLGLAEPSQPPGRGPAHGPGSSQWPEERAPSLRLVDDELKTTGAVGYGGRGKIGRAHV